MAPSHCQRCTPRALLTLLWSPSPTHPAPVFLPFLCVVAREIFSAADGSCPFTPLPGAEYPPTLVLFCFRPDSLKSWVNPLCPLCPHSLSASTFLCSNLNGLVSSRIPSCFGACVYEGSVYPLYPFTQLHLTELSGQADSANGEFLHFLREAFPTSWLGRILSYSLPFTRFVSITILQLRAWLLG